MSTFAASGDLTRHEILSFVCRAIALTRTGRTGRVGVAPRGAAREAEGRGRWMDAAPWNAASDAMVARPTSADENKHRNG